MQPVREVYSLLMPIRDGRLIVPRAAVAEITGYTRPKDRPEEAPPFMLGFIEWQRQRIPLVSFEAACGGEVPELGRRTRIAVVFGVAGRLEPNLFAVVTQGYPYLVRVNENVLQREEMESSDPLVLARVRMANEKPYIPNFEQLEILIAESLGIEPPDAAADSLEPEAVGESEVEEFEVGLVEEEDAVAVDKDGVDNDDPGGPDVNFGEVTAFGTETNYSTELDELSGALERDGADSGEQVAEGEGVDLGDVTAFGVETGYSIDSSELSDALEREPAVNSDGGETSSGEYALDFSALEIDDTDATAAPENPDGEDETEIDFSALEIDLDIENKDDDKKDPE